MKITLDAIYDGEVFRPKVAFRFETNRLYSITVTESAGRYGSLNHECFAALLYDELEDYEEAIGSLTEYLSNDPTSVAALNNRAIAYWETGDIERALVDFEQAMRLATIESSPAKNCGHLRQSKGDLAGALADFDAGVTIAPNDPHLRRTRAYARFEANDLEGALEDFGVAIAVEPRFSQQYLDRANIFERLGRHDLAENDRLVASRL